MLSINLKGKTALVTGVSNGIGLGIAKMLAKAGCDISGCGLSAIDSEAAQTYITSIQAENRKALYTSLDITSNKDREALVNKTITAFKKIDILISNAGANIFEGAEKCTDKKWQFNMELNLKSHWALSKLCKPYLESSNNGVILLMTSNHAYHTIPGCFPYNVTKTALKALVQSLAIEWGPKIRTIGIAPGFIDTPGNQKWFDSFPDAKAERHRTINMHPVKKIGTTEDVGMLCAFLASDMASFISGTTYLIDGGRSALMQD
ncbi:SDR family NAD(P)-dependent oxidoreductase [Snuella sedimenti]|uniref:SDR family oxidoreductase n=1 Tax=Snuella sedimenti TaxID=2798802 RepID=A0A8J7J0D6_9FLAO|nr:SDR family oxidoreductase [Snuella sedimenti]MBJ6367192.1 SDR family oxidoreductase [Snuella sedimenti]